MTKTLSRANRERVCRYQQQEATGAILYDYMASVEKNGENARILREMAGEERRHAEVWSRYSGRIAGPVWWKILARKILVRLLGFTFVLKLMERDEAFTQEEYESLVDEIPEMRGMLEQEERHETQLQSMLDEERLRYVGAMVLGLNDALVELTGTIAGLTFALADNRLVALAGIITGVAATLSMAASNYLAERADGATDAVKSSAYTGAAYLVTVVCLVAPYLTYPSHMYVTALVTMLAVVCLIIFGFNYYISVAKDVPFWPRFREMAGISLGVAALSFLIGLAAKQVLGVDV